jgi:tetratricopeptide (TPR) repeat protein
MVQAGDEADAVRWDSVEEAAELLREERFVEAMVVLRDVIKADPRNPYAYYFLGNALFETGQREAARDAYRAAITLAPDYLGARVGLSQVLRLLGDPKGALAQAKEALRRFPNDADAMYAAGLANAALGNRAAARQNLSGFLAKGPELEAATEVRQILEMLGLGDEDEPIEFD